MSFGEAEYYGLAKGACVCLGSRSLFADLGIELRTLGRTDSTAARGTCKRTGLGKMRHLEVQYLWLQEKIRCKAPRVTKVWGHQSPEDLMTKYLDSAGINRHSATMEAMEGKWVNLSTALGATWAALGAPRTGKMWLKHSK